MNEQQLLILNLVTRVGLDAAVALLESVGKVTTIDEAIQALKDAQQISYKKLKQP